MARSSICRPLSFDRLFFLSKRLFSSSPFTHSPLYRRPHSLTRFIFPSAAVPARLTTARFITDQSLDSSETLFRSYGGDGEGIEDIHPLEQSSETPVRSDGADVEPKFHLKPEDKYFTGCDFEHWLVVMDSPGGEGATEEQKSDCYVQTLAKVLGSEEEAKMKIYDVSVDNAFGCAIDEETSNKLQSIPGVRFILPDNAEKDEGDEKSKKTSAELAELVSGFCKHIAKTAVKSEADHIIDPSWVAEADNALDPNNVTVEAKSVE